MAKAGSWSKMLSPISVAISAFAALILVSTLANAAGPKLLSRAGEGQKFDAYLVSKEAVGLENNHFANVRFVSPGAKASTAEWIVNCNETMPQVLSPAGVNSEVVIERPPSSKDRFKFELWFAVCRNELLKADFRRPTVEPIPPQVAAAPVSAEATPRGIHEAIKAYVRDRVAKSAEGHTFEKADRFSPDEVKRRLGGIAVTDLRTGPIADSVSGTWLSLVGESTSALCSETDGAVASCVFFDGTSGNTHCDRVEGVYSATLLACQVRISYGTGFYQGGEAIFAATGPAIRYIGYLPTTEYTGIDEAGDTILNFKATNEFSESDDFSNPNRPIALRRCPVLSLDGGRPGTVAVPCEEYAFDRAANAFVSKKEISSVGQSLMEIYKKEGQRLSSQR